MKATDPLLEAFLSSSFFAEAEAAPVVDKLLACTESPEERALLASYAAEETEHARLLDELFQRRGLHAGKPFWIQSVFRRFRSRSSLLLQFYNVEVLAGAFYGAVASRVQDDEVHTLLRRLLRDEARHIRLHRELLAREIARSSRGTRLRVRFLAWLFRVGGRITAWYQARQLGPLLGDVGSAVRQRITRKLAKDRAFLFAGAPRTELSLDWWWRGVQDDAQVCTDLHSVHGA